MVVECHDEPRQFFWHELATTDPRDATDFYGAVLGWRAVPLEGTPSYWTWLPVHEGSDGKGRPGRRGRGGLTILSARPDGESPLPAWQGCVRSPDPGEDARRAAFLGGEIVAGLRTVPQLGTMTVIADPFGARVTLMSPTRAEDDLDADGADPAKESETGRFGWWDLAVPEPDAALEFYGELLGWTVTESLELASGAPYRVFGSNGVELGGIVAGRLGEPGEHGAVNRPAWRHSVLVGNLEEALRRVGKSGGEVLFGPTELPGALVAHCSDRQGARFALRQEWEGKRAR